MLLRWEKYLDLLDEIKTRQFSKLVRQIQVTLDQKLHSHYFTPLMQEYFKSKNESGEPYTNFNSEPAPISQIKKIMNALYHTECALCEVESLDYRSVSRVPPNLYLLYNSTFHHVYLAFYPLMHFDVSLVEIFKPELNTLKPLFEMALRFAARYQRIATLPKEADVLASTKKLGVITGILVDQLQPQSGKVDFEFLTQFTARIPHYIDQLNLYIVKFSESIPHGPSVDRKKLDELQNEALKLLLSLEDLRVGSSIQIINYIRIVRHSITLTMSIISQIVHLYDSSQDVLRDKLKEFKYQLLAQLFVVADKIEIECMFVPGTVSVPLVQRIEKLYALIISYLQKFVDFNHIGKELLILQDERLLRVRLESVNERIAEHNKMLSQIEIAEKNVTQFFFVIKKKTYENTRVCQLKNNLKKHLLTQFPLFNDYLAQLDYIAHNLILSELTREVGWGESILHVIGMSQKGKCKVLLPLENQIRALLAKEKESYIFQNKLTNGIINFIIATGKSFDINLVNIIPVPKPVTRAETPRVLSLVNPPERAEYIIPHQHFSEWSRGLKKFLQRSIAIFNNSLGQILKPKEQGIPFPEMIEPSYQVLEEPDISGFFKRLSNSTYHLELGTANLENLRKNSTEVVFVFNLMQASKQFYEILEIIRRIAENPFFSLLTQDLLARLHHTKKTFLHLQELYLWKIQPTGTEMVGKAAVIYVLNALLLLPQHLDGLVESKTLEPTEIEEKRLIGNQLAEKIAHIVVHSHSYFQIFLNTPSIYGLFYQLKEKISLLSSCGHEAIAGHLDEIKNSLMLQIVIEADEWEGKLFLKPGLLSGSMKKLLDTYFYGLLEPLNLNSVDFLGFVNNFKAFDKRLSWEGSKILKARTTQAEINQTLEELLYFLKTVSQYKKALGLDNETLSQAEKSIRAAYLVVYPFIIKNRKNLGRLKESQCPYSSHIDNVLNGRTHNTEELGMACVSYCRGLYNSQQLVIDSAREKINYLTQLRQEQKETNAQIIREYAVKIFKRLEKNAVFPFNFVHCNAEYFQRMRMFLQSVQPKIIDQAILQENIKLAIEESLQSHLTDFETKNFKQYYQLESIMAAIGQLKLYIHKSNNALSKNKCVFENSNTLSNKSNLVKELEDLAFNEEETIDKRLSCIHKMVRSYRFENTMLAYHKYESYTYDWLKQVVYSLLELIHLYTPEPKKLHQRLKCLTAEPIEAEPRNSINFFPTHVRNYSLPIINNVNSVNLGLEISSG